MKVPVLCFCTVLGCAGKLAAVDAPTVADAGTADAPSADWVIAIDPASSAGRLDPGLLGQYDLSGALFHYDQQPQLVPLMKAAGMASWRVGVGRWEFGTLLLPSLTDGTACPAVPPPLQAPAGATDQSLIAARDWFTYTDGSAVTAAMTADDTRYQLDYVRSVIDVATAYGAAAYVDIDHMPRALAANQTPVRTNAQWPGACGVSWTNEVSNVRPADASVFAAAVVGLVRRVVEGSGSAAGRPVRDWEMWNEPDLAYAWNPNVGNFMTYLITAAVTLTALDTYRTQTANPDGKAIRIGLGSFANAAIAAQVVAQLDVPYDFISFHSESYDDPLMTVADIAAVDAGRKQSAHHQTTELVLAEWNRSVRSSTLDPKTMDVALHDATVLALGPAAGLSRAHHALFWDFLAPGVPDLGFIDHDFTPLPAYYVYTLLAQLVGGGATRLAPQGQPDGKLDAGMAAVLAATGSDGKVRVFLVNREQVAHTARIDLPTGTATATRVQTFADPAAAPADVAPSPVIAVPARSIVLVEL